MENIHTVKDLLKCWPSRKALSDALSKHGEDVPVTRIHRWAQTNSINAKYFHVILEECADIGLDLSADDLVRIHHKPKKM